MKPTVEALLDAVTKSAIRSVKANMAATAKRPMTAAEEDVLSIGIHTGAAAMAQELVRLGAIKEDW